MVDNTKYWPKPIDKTKDLHLPARVYRKGGSLYFTYIEPQTKIERWIPIGQEWNHETRERWRVLALRHGTARYIKKNLYTEDGGPVALQALKDLLANARKNARARGLEITITIEDIKALAELSQGCCMLSGIPFEHGASDDLLESTSRRKRVWAPSLDRIESSKGYVPGNVRLVCMAVNAALQEFGDSVLLRIAHALVKRHGISNIQ